MLAAVRLRRHQADVRDGRQHPRPGHRHPPARAEASRQGALAHRAGDFQRRGLCENEPLCTFNQSGIDFLCLLRFQVGTLIELAL